MNYDTIKEVTQSVETLIDEMVASNVGNNKLLANLINTRKAILENVPSKIKMLWLNEGDDLATKYIEEHYVESEVA
tara:strand:+ start:86 stop:313 length:228 start_codon:yes stop_codon:yes gene_type:complete